MPESNSSTEQPTDRDIGFGERDIESGPAHVERTVNCGNCRWRSTSLRSLEHGFTYYSITTFVVLLGVMLGISLFNPSLNIHPRADDSRSGNAVLDAMTGWDGGWYVGIVKHGYAYDPDRQSSVAFFPAYPLMVRYVHQMTGLSVHLAALLVSHACLLGSMGVLVAYVRQRFPTSCEQITPYVLLAFGLFPMTFFLRMAYSESLFLFLCILALYGMEKKWPVLLIAFVVGIATATRAVGVALLLPLMLFTVKNRQTAWGAATQMLYLIPVACWGLLDYILFLQLEFGNALAFVQTQRHWQMRPALSLGARLEVLFSLEPIWSVYVPSSPAYWGRFGHGLNPLFNPLFANPIYFVLAAVLTVIGALKRWLTWEEVLLAAGMLLIPYVTKSYENGMSGQGRFAAAVFPIYIVLGIWLSRLSLPIVVGFFALAIFFLAVYAAMFAAGCHIV